MAFSRYSEQVILGRTLGPSRGVMDTGRYGVSPMSVPPGFMPKGQNLLLTAAGGFEPRPGIKRHSDFNGNCQKATLLKVVPLTESTAMWVMVGNVTAGAGYNRGQTYALTETIIAATSFASGAMRGATCGALARVGGEVALLMTNNDGATPPWYVRLPSETVGSVVGLPTAMQYAGVCATGGNRYWLAADNTVWYSTPHADLTSATTGTGSSWEASDYIVLGVSGNPVDKIVGMFQFGDYMVAMSARRAYLIPLDNPQNFQVALDFAVGKAQEYGLVNVNAFAIGDGEMYFCSGRDFYRWTPGVGIPESLTKADGLSTVSGRFLDPNNDFGECAAGYDAQRRIVLFSYKKDGATHNNHTLAYDLDRQAWCDWTFGSYVFDTDNTAQSPLTGKSLWLARNTESAFVNGPAPCTLDRAKAADDVAIADIDATAGVIYVVTEQAAINMIFSTHEFSEVNSDLQVKSLRLLVDAAPQDGVPLSRGVLECTVYTDGDNIADWQQQNVGDPYAGDAGSAVEGVAVVGASQMQSVIFTPDVQAAQGRSMSFQFNKNDGLPIRVLGAEAQIRSRRQGRVYAT